VKRTDRGGGYRHADMQIHGGLHMGAESATMTVNDASVTKAMAVPILRSTGAIEITGRDAPCRNKARWSYKEERMLESMGI